MTLPSRPFGSTRAAAAAVAARAAQAAPAKRAAAATDATRTAARWRHRSSCLVARGLQ